MTDVVKKGIDKVRLMYVASMRALALARSTSAHRRQQVLMFFHSVALCPKLTACARDDNGRAECSHRAGLERSEPETPAELLDEYTSCASLTYEQRMYGFLICALSGACCSALSSMFWARPTKFALLSTVGAIMSLVSTGFLTGFGRQLKNMFHGTRFVATCVYLASLIMTLVCAVKLKSFPLTVVFLGVQYCAYIWYCMSYIPGGRAMLKSCAGACCGGLTSNDFF